MNADDTKTLDAYLAEAEDAVAQVKADAHPDAMFEAVKLAFRAFAKALRFVGEKVAS